MAQDTHWSQFFLNPIYLNPANSGNFIGDSRFHINYRDQWRSVTKAFQTFSICYDTRFKKYENFGLSVLVFNDAAGDGKFKTTEIQLAPSYRKIISKDSNSTFALGAQLALNHRNFTFPNFFFDEQYTSSGFDPNAPVTEPLITSKKTTFSCGLGGLFSRKFSNYKFELGASLFNINQANQSFYGDKAKRDMRLSLNTNLEITVNSKVQLIPTILFQKQGKYQEFIAGGRLKYSLKNQINFKRALYAGLFFRNKDAFYLNLGLDYNKFHFGVSYDVNISKLNLASGGRGGFEFACRYIIYKFKPKQIQHRICPEFI